MEGVDYSFGRPGGAALAAAGKEFAVRYVPYIGDGGKGLTDGERVDLHENGIGVGLVFESTAGRALEGYDRGALDGDLSRTAARRLGFPDHVPVFFAIDIDTTPTDYPAIFDYFNGVAAGMVTRDRVGAYGEYDVLKALYEAGLSPWLWQTYAWSGGRKYEYRHLLQYLNGQEINGAAVDFNEAYTRLCFWWPSSSQEDDVTLAELNAFLVKRERIRHIASATGDGPDGDALMLAAYEALREKGLVP